MAQSCISSAALQHIGARFRGTLIGPGDAAYERARQVWNGAIDRRPALIARCMGADDVIAALQLARGHHLPVAVRSGGHSVAGHGVCDGGLVVDLSAMKGLLVDRQRRTARAEPGLTAGELVRETLAVGLALPTGAGTETGIGGLTLGGGLGWLGGLYGLTCDSLLAVEIVTADGRLRTASAQEHPDLFWAVRGGGGNFGVVTSLTFQLQAVGPVLSGLLVHPLARAHEVLALYRAVTRHCPDELTIDLGLLTAPDGQPIVGLLPCYAGPLEAGERVLAPLRAFGPPVADLIRPMTLLETGELVDATSPPGRCYCFRAQTLAQLTDAAIATIVAQVAERPSPFCHAVLRHMHGAATRVAPDATAVALRQEHYCLEIVAVWTGDAAQRHTGWVQRFSAAMEPFAQRGVLVNFLGEEGETRVQATSRCGAAGSTQCQPITLGGRAMLRSRRCARPSVAPHSRRSAGSVGSSGRPATGVSRARHAVATVTVRCPSLVGRGAPARRPAASRWAATVRPAVNWAAAVAGTALAIQAPRSAVTSHVAEFSPRPCRRTDRIVPGSQAARAARRSSSPSTDPRPIDVSSCVPIAVSLPQLQCYRPM